MATKEVEVKEQWHLDKKVPIALIMALVIQFAVGMTYTVSTRTQGDENARRITALESQRVGERLSSMEAKVSNTESLILRVESKVDRLAERQRP